MRYYLNKKSAVSGFLIMVLIITAGFVVIFMVLPAILGGADVAVADSLCKGSVALKARSHTEINAPLIGTELFDFSTPLLCKTSTFTLPEDKNANKEDIKKEFSDLIASCWNRYGEGQIKDVFLEGSQTINNCQVCYSIDLRETSNFKKGSSISSEDFSIYLSNTAYKVQSDDGVDDCTIGGGYCMGSDNIDKCGEKFEGVDISDISIEPSSVCTRKGKTSCCYSDFECLNRGGICAEEDPTGQDEKPFAQYDEWNCQEDLKCWVKNENHFTYGGYVQEFGGEGLIIVTTGINPGETYAVSFGSRTNQCDWCKTAGAIAGGAAAVGTIIGGGLLIATGVIGTPFTLGASLSLVVVGGVIIGSVTYVGATAASEGFQDIKVLWAERDINTVYFTTLNQIHAEGEELCKFVESI